MNKDVHPILYTFRRCPYAMRARLALSYSKIIYEHREIILRDKPAHLLEISPKGTVPVLRLTSGKILEESLDIVNFALGKNDPENWNCIESTHMQEKMNHLIHHNDTVFKHNLDRYKYPNRYPNEPAQHLGEHARDQALQHLSTLEKFLKTNMNLLRDTRSKADIAIFPFIRQFAHVDREWFNAQNLPNLQKWLATHKESTLFKAIMEKHNRWTQGAPQILINA